jgi:general stress protein YciG
VAEKPNLLSKYLAELGKKGGKARVKNMTAEERREAARKAGQASGRARRAKKKG